MVGAVIEDSKAGLADHIRAVAQARDKAAFAALYAYYAPRVKGYLIRLGTPAAQAEDLAQDVMVAVWRKAALYDPAKAEASTWVFTIARNLRIDALRRARHTHVDLDAEGVLELPDHSPPADQRVADGQRAALVRTALSGLPPEQADVVRRSFFLGQAHTEIAETLGLPLGTVKSRMRLAMAKIRTALGAVGVAEAEMHGDAR